MTLTYYNARIKYINHKGQSSFDKLYRKISECDTLNELCGLSAKIRKPLTSQDYIYKASLMPSIYFTFDNAKSAMAALIMLEIWNERINSVYQLLPEFQVERIAQEIVATSIVLR